LNSVLQISNLSKRFGRVTAVDSLTLEVGKGEVFGILGPNGSGKTTTLSIVLDVIRADGGVFSWFGNKPTRHDRKRIGAILEQPVFYPFLSAFNNLQIVADIKGSGHGNILSVLELTGLLERKDSHFRTFSFGMKQRLAIASALLSKPDVLIFDEPTNGLDPGGIAEIRKLILDLAAQGYTIILASHLLDEVQKTCSHVAVMNKGKLLFHGRVDEILHPQQKLELGAPDLETLREACLQSGCVIETQQKGELLVAFLNKESTPEQLHRFLIGRGIVLTHLSRSKETLETKFLALLKATK